MTISRSKLIFLVVIIILTGFLYELGPSNIFGSVNNYQIFEIKSGQGLRTIGDNLIAAGLIHSPLAFEAYVFLSGNERALRPGLYRISPDESIPKIMQEFIGADAGGTDVIIPEGSNMYQIDTILGNALVVKRGSFIAYAASMNLEGRLFPDTYQFVSGESLPDIAKTLTETFSQRTQNILPQDPAKASTTIILASILEKEVRSDADRRIVAGILEKRLANGIALDVDASVCYAKQVQNPDTIIDCTSLTLADYKIDSPYNTYLYKGLPPGPIGNPGLDTIRDVLASQSSAYLYYLTDPKTGNTIYAKTLEEQNANRIKYLNLN